jgi:hypothetical protein
MTSFRLEEVHSARNIGTSDEVAPSDAVPYWVFVSNPKKWAIDRFLDREIQHDNWDIRPSDRDRFAPGQLGIIRVGVDKRTVAERGSALLQLGRLAGLEMSGTCSSRGASAVSDLGGIPIDYQHQDFVKEIYRLTSASL